MTQRNFVPECLEDLENPMPHHHPGGDGDRALGHETGGGEDVPCEVRHVGCLVGRLV